MATGFGWAWVVLGDSRGADRIRGALEAAGGAADPRQRAEALLLVGWIEASTGHLEPARGHVQEAASLAEATGSVELQARAAYYLAYVVSHQGDFRGGLALTDQSRALYAGLDRPWDLAANGLFATRAAISAGDEVRAARCAEELEGWLGAVDDPWLHVRGEAMQGELARLQRRFDDAVTHLAKAAETSHRLGFQQTNAYQVASLGRAQCQAGDYESGVQTLASAVERAEATGDVRMAALARVHLGRVLRAVGRPEEARAVLQHAVEWHRQAGGGEQALLGECLLEALEPVDLMRDVPSRLPEILAQARREGDAPVEVFTLDALALRAASSGDATSAAALLRQADDRMLVASHFIAERDRVDAAAARVTPIPLI
jgi:tetratricopeptide (TPR) repeat protein